MLSLAKSWTRDIIREMFHLKKKEKEEGNGEGKEGGLSLVFI